MSAAKSAAAAAAAKADQAAQPEAEDEGGEDEEYASEGDWLAFVRSAYEAVEAGAGQLIKWAHDPDAKVREAAVYALAWFPRQARISAPVVRSIAQKSDIAPAERANALLSLELLDRALGEQQDGSGSGSGDTALFTSLLTDDYPQVVRLAGAIALGITRESTLPAEALATLLAAVGNSPDGDSSGSSASAANDEEESFYWNDGDLVGFASLVLSSSSAGSGEEGKERIVGTLCTALTTAAPMSSLTLTQALLDVVLRDTPDSPPTVPDSLTPLQKQALQAIARHGAWRVANADFINYSNLVAAYGLPDSQDKLREFTLTH